MMRCRNSLLPFLLLAAFLSISAEDCNRTCGHNSVSYPFGFSPGCPIRLNCNKTAAILLGGYHVLNITTESIIVDIPADCNRRVGDVGSLFGENYAMTTQNGLLLNCNHSIPSLCFISREDIAERLGVDNICGDKGGNITCYSGGRKDGYLSTKNISEIKREKLFMSVWVTQTDLQFGRAELRWWMNGECPCSANATSSSVVTSVPGKRGCSCSCQKGFTGDGFADGDGCKKGLSSSPL